MSKRKKGFTLIELIAVLVILAIIVLIVTPLVLNVIRKAKDSANKRSIDAYGKAMEIALMGYVMYTGDTPNNLNELTVEYTGNKVECNVKQITENGSIYLTECKVNGVKVKDKSTDDGWYHYGELIIPTAVETLLSKTNAASVTTYTDGNKHEMYTFSHDATTQTEALTDYRYIGNDPYNYIIFNNELWRIIGVFTVEDLSGNKEQRIKIIRDESIGDYSWNSNGSNDWATASLQAYLNGDYYNSLSEEAKVMIGDAKYYLGGGTWHSTTYYGTTSEIYTWERGTIVNSGRSTNWIGKIGLMYPSDYAYTYALGVDNKCYIDISDCDTSTPSSGWLYNGITEWLISPYGTSNTAFSLFSSGAIFSRYDVGYVLDPRGGRPTAYLLSSIQLDKGTGTEDDPYTLK